MVDHFSIISKKKELSDITVLTRIDVFVLSGNQDYT
jgi:hypothetical protein